MMQLRISERKKAKIKMALQGSSGSGKTYNSLLLAKGLTGGDLTKVAIVDSENGSADLYSHLGQYNVLTLSPPFTPEKYIEAISVCEKAGMEVIILDSISHCWDELLDYHSKLAGNSFTNWSKVTPRQKSFVDKILQSNTHIIATMRTKTDYVIQQQDNKFKVEKLGLKSIQRDGMDYEFTIVFDIDIKHFATCSKDRTNLFTGKPEFIITEETGKTILNWCNSGKEITIEEVRQQIRNCESIEGLKSIYNLYIEWKDQLNQDLVNRKKEIEFTEDLLNPKNYSHNGSPTTAV